MFRFNRNRADRFSTLNVATLIASMLSSAYATQAVEFIDPFSDRGSSIDSLGKGLRFSPIRYP
jgi:hypothetical protein